MINKIVSSIVVAVLVLAGSLQAQSTNVVSTNVVEQSGVAIPVVTPTVTGVVGTGLNILSQVPLAVKATIVADGVDWIVKHGAVSTGPGFTPQGKYGAMVGQDVKVYSVGIVGTNEFDVTVSHANYLASTGGNIDEFGIGLNKTIPAPKWLSNFVIISSRPSTLKFGLGVYIPTTSIVHGSLNSKQVVFGPRLAWTF